MTFDQHAAYVISAYAITAIGLAAMAWLSWRRRRSLARTVEALKADSPRRSAGADSADTRTAAAAEASHDA